MTYSKEKLHSGQRAPRTMVETFSLEWSRVLEVTGQSGRLRWPDPRYQNDPHAFFREVLGVEPWGAETDERAEHGQSLLLSLIRDNWRTAVRAGRKVSKSMTAAGIALWWYSCFYDAQVVMSSVTARQVDEILWDEMRKLHDRSQRPIEQGNPALKIPPDPALLRNPDLATRPIDGEPKILARSGLVSGFRRVAGFTAREGVAAQGKSGAHLLYLLDEASGISQAIFTAIVGNMAASGCKLVLFGNPTVPEGEFFEAFNSLQKTADNPRGYATLTISSEESPNVTERRDVVPGLASLEYIQDREREWGRDSVEFKVHVLGQHVSIEEGKIVSLAAIRDAEERWNATGESAVPAEGVLHIGVDPAFSSDGDEAVFVPRRGKRVLEIRAERGLSDEEGHLSVVLDLIREYRHVDEYVVVCLDALGDVGSRVQYRLRDYADKHPGMFFLVPIRASDNAIREPMGYYHVYDELWGVVGQWLKEGGALPEDIKLERDLHAPSWKFDKQQRKVATRKDELRRKLKRSPDRGNAVCLACWECGTMAEQSLAADKQMSAMRHERASLLDEPAAQGLDPFAAMDEWSR